MSKCVKPVTAFELLGQFTAKGKKLIVFSDPEPGVKFVRVVVACGRCIGCRLRRRLDWANRLQHESQLHEDCCFLTLTYDDEHLPYGGTLVKEHGQKFIRALRKRISPVRIRFFLCGEYGGKFQRPHYHAIIFGYDFPDRVLAQVLDGNDFFESEILSKCWRKGFASVSGVSADTMSYVAGYTVSKISGDLADEHYCNLVESTGELVQVLPEYATMSRRPGIGFNWFLKFCSDVFPDDFVVRKGVPVIVPRYYYRKLEEFDPKLFELVERERNERFVSLQDGLRKRLQAVEENLIARSAESGSIGRGKLRHKPGVSASDLDVSARRVK